MLSVGSVGLIRAFSLKKGLIVSPRADRWNQRSVALHGGIGIFFAWLLPALFALISNPPENQWLPILFVVACLLMFLTGFFDDFYHLRPGKKLVLEIIAAAILVASGIVIDVFPWYTLNVILTFIWFIGIINSVNMLDNIDGLSAGIVAISISVLLIVFLLSNGLDHLSVKWMIIFLACLCGFLVFNFPPASIFMGDSGSLFLGYFLAAISIPSELNRFWFTAASHSTQVVNLIPLLLPALVLAVPIFDTTLVTLSRIWKGKSVTQGGRDHSSHRLVGLGLSETKSVLSLYFLSILGGILAIVFHFSSHLGIYFFLLFLVTLVLFGSYLGRHKVYQEESSPPRWTPLITKFFYKRRFLEVMMDLIFLILSYQFSFLILFNDRIDEYFIFYSASLPYVVVISLIIFWGFHFYKSFWHLIGIGDLRRYIVGIISTAALFMATYLFHDFANLKIFPPLKSQYFALLIVFTLLLMFFILGSRIFFRYLDDWIRQIKLGSNRKKIMIYGAGRGGKIVISELKGHPLYNTQYQPLCFLDDNENKANSFLEGIPVISSKSLPLDQAVDEIWISTESITSERILQKTSLFKKKPIVKRVSILIRKVPD